MKAEEARLLQGFLDNKSYPVVTIKAMDKKNGGYHVHFANYSHLHKTLDIGHPQNVPTLLDNLCRLGILEMPFGVHLNDPKVYDEITVDLELHKVRDEITNIDREIGFEKKLVRLTTFGRLFVARVVRNKS